MCNGSERSIKIQRSLVDVSSTSGAQADFLACFLTAACPSSASLVSISPLNDAPVVVYHEIVLHDVDLTYIDGIVWNSDPHQARILFYLFSTLHLPL